jgi:hypothetical protein
MLTAAPPINLSQAEIDEICEPLVSAHAQVKYLERLGLLVARKPNGRPLVARSEYERVRGAGRFAVTQQNGGAQPDRAALMKVIQGGKRGPQTQGR